MFLVAVWCSNFSDVVDPRELGSTHPSGKKGRSRTKRSGQSCRGRTEVRDPSGGRQGDEGREGQSLSVSFLGTTGSTILSKWGTKL